MHRHDMVAYLRSVLWCGCDVSAEDVISLTLVRHNLLISGFI